MQQETEIRRLKESLDIRNKRIMQLDGQVGIATSYISNRNDSTGPISKPDQANFQETLHSLMSKVDSLSRAISTPLSFYLYLDV